MNVRRNARRKNRGAVLLVLLLVFVLALGSVAIASLARQNTETARQQKTLDALAQARQALIAWSVMQGDMWPETKLVSKKDADGNPVTVETFTYYRPGSLPCPDRTSPDDTSSGASPGGAEGSCSAGGGTSLGRLPWKSLGVEKLTDGYGETLWYALSDRFRIVNTSSSIVSAINSDTPGSLLLYAADGTTLLTPPGEELAAIVFAPGPPLPGQDRTSSTQAVNYLEAFNGKNNANAAGPFIAGPVRDSNGHLVANDLAIGLTARELVAAIETRALQEAQNALGQLPELPHPANASGCTSPVRVTETSLCASDDTACSGRLPEEALEPYAAKWFTQNGWGRVMIYAINGAGCASVLKVGENPVNYVLFAPGAARSGQKRPSTSLSDYLEDTGNTGGWSGSSSFVVPGTGSNDQLRTHP